MSNQAQEADNQRTTGKGKSRKINIGIVGCGEVTQIMHWPSLSQLAELYEVTALCDISPLVLETLGKRWNVGALATDHRELVGRSDIDAVLVASPHAFHAEVTLAAIAAGKHVLVEKPMCMNQREAKEIVAAQRKSQVVVQVGYMRRYAPAFLYACDAVKKIGDIKFARVQDFLGSNSLIINQTSAVVRDNHLLKALQEEASRRDEELVIEALGGNRAEDVKTAYRLMLGLSSHDLSAMRELIGMPAEVLFAAQRAGGRYLAAAFDYGAFVCQFETGIDKIPRFDAHLEVFGEQKTLRVQYDTPYVRNLPIRVITTESNGEGGVTTIDAHPAWGDPFVAEWKAFYNNVTENRLPKSGPEDFLLDLELFTQMVQLIG
ncbi:MAG: Gfo/Idh/MocA family oxidoreductase [Verrucomicrobia bacterium]|nr:Gfo/Idh/MocA family oxidoreductase [Verrucomicrobiota bacterium]